VIASVFFASQQATDALLSGASDNNEVFRCFPFLINTLRFGCCLTAYRDQHSIDQSRATRQQMATPHNDKLAVLIDADNAQASIINELMVQPACRTA